MFATRFYLPRRAFEATMILASDGEALTGVWFEEAAIGAACYDRTADRVDFVLHPRVPGAYHGTGDLVASILLGGLMQGLSLQDACGCAVRGVAKCIRHTVESGRTDTRWGVRFEDCLFFLMKDVFSLAK